MVTSGGTATAYGAAARAAVMIEVRMMLSRKEYDRMKEVHVQLRGFEPRTYCARRWHHAQFDQG